MILKTRQKWSFWCVVIATAAAATFYILYLNDSFRQEYASTIEKLSQPANLGLRSRVYIDFGDGTKRAFEGRMLNSMAIKYILAASSEAGNLEIILTKDQKKITAVAGVANSADKKWDIYLNDDDRPIENVSVLMRPGDKATLIYK